MKNSKPKANRKNPARPRPKLLPIAEEARRCSNLNCSPGPVCSQSACSDSAPFIVEKESSPPSLTPEDSVLTPPSF